MVTFALQLTIPKAEEGISGTHDYEINGMPVTEQLQHFFVTQAT